LFSNQYRNDTLEAQKALCPGKVRTLAPLKEHRENTAPEATSEA